MTRRRVGLAVCLLVAGAAVQAQAAEPGPARAFVPGWALVAAGVAGAATTAFVLAWRRLREIDGGPAAPRGRNAWWQQQYDELLEYLGEVVAVHDAEGRLIVLNGAGERLTGYTRDELRAVEPEWVFGEDYLDTIRRLVADGIGAAPRSFRTALRTRQGERIPVEVRAGVVVDAGRVVGVTAAARDLRDHERADAEWRQTQKMEAVGRLATGIAHDFNNLITVQLGYADDLLQHGAPGSDDWRRSAEEVRRAAERAAGLTQQLLAFSRRQSSAPRTVDLNDIVAQMEELLRRLMGAEVALAFDLDPDLDPIHVDPGQASQVLMNLAVNARDAMPDGGRLTIETANVTLGHEHLDVIPGPHVMLAVHDTGTGMSDDVRRRLFEPFFTTKGEGQGTGIGLPLVQAIVRQSGGQLAVESEPGHGSVFRAYFPAVADEAVAAQVPASQATAAPGTGVVLVVEDDEVVLRLVARELARRGYTVLPAEDGRAAIEMAEAHGSPIDLLLTDIVMPRMSGTDLAATLVARQPDLRVVYMTGHPDRAAIEAGPAAGPVLMKPFTPQDLAASVRSAREQAHG